MLRQDTSGFNGFLYLDRGGNFLFFLSLLEGKGRVWPARFS